jgi:hypothetical protein
MGTMVLPPREQVRDLLHELFGRDIEVSATAVWSPGARDKVVAAEFRDNVDHMAACVAVDLSLAIFLGAAVGMLPAGGAQDMAADGELTPIVSENLYEVFNVLSTVLNQPGGTHVKLGTMFGPEETLPSDLASRLATPGSRLDVNVVVSGYGGGHLVLALGIADA